MIFASAHPDRPEDDDLYEERIVLLRSGSEDEAKAKAEAIAREQGEKYKNVYEETVRWSFVEVIDVKQVLSESIADGTEVYYCFLRKDELDQIKQMLTTTL